jgi:hypothetical protein
MNFTLNAPPMGINSLVVEDTNTNTDTDTDTDKTKRQREKKDKDIVDKTYPQRLCTPNFQNEFYIISTSNCHAIKLTIARENKILVLTYDVCILMKNLPRRHNTQE